jgi:hypothetical protein
MSTLRACSQILRSVQRIRHNNEDSEEQSLSPPSQKAAVFSTLAMNHYRLEYRNFKEEYSYTSANMPETLSNRTRPLFSSTNARGVVGILLAGSALITFILSELVASRSESFFDHCCLPAPAEHGHRQLAGIVESESSDIILSIPSPEESTFDPLFYMSDVSNSFDGVWARPYKPWWFDHAPVSNSTAYNGRAHRGAAGRGAHPIPCLLPEPNWSSARVQDTPTSTGLLFLKPYKTASSTGAGIHLRIARNAARRRHLEIQSASTELSNASQSNDILGFNQPWPICKVRMSHGPFHRPAHLLGYGKQYFR